MVLVVACIGVFFGFTKHIPFTHGFRVKAVFESSNSIRKNSPVRIAGVNVGKVTKVEGKPGSDAAVVTMEINGKGLPIHKDATMKIRPRIFLEGNFFVDVTPGTPSAPTIDDGDTIPMTQTATPVQLDQVLSALQSDTRTSLQKTLDGLGTGLTYKPSKAQDTDADPSARGESAGQSLNDAIRYGERSLKGTAIVADAFLGTEDHDLSRLIDGLSRTTEGLGRNEAQLKDLVTNFNTTVAATASQAANLRASIRLLGPTLQNADRALDSLNAVVPQHARLRARDPARRQRDGRHHRRRLPVDRAGARAARALRAAGRRARAEPGDARPGQGHRRDPGAAAAGRPGGQVRHAASSCPPAT